MVGRREGRFSGVKMRLHSLTCPLPCGRVNRPINPDFVEEFSIRDSLRRKGGERISEVGKYS